MSIVLDVKITKIRFHSPESGFAVVEANHDKKNIIMVGILGELFTGERLRVTGDFVKDAKWGEQLKVTSFELPDVRSGGLQDFLLSGYIKCLSEEMALDIYERFGDAVVDILDGDGHELLDIKGVGPKNLKKILESWHEHKTKREAIGFFAKWGIGPQTIQKILVQWPNVRDAIRIVRENPYLLAWKIHGIGFLKADEIACALGFARNSPQRIGAAIGYTLDEAAKNEGHCFLMLDELGFRVTKLLGPECSRDDIIYTLVDLYQTEMISIEDGNKVYLPAIQRSEKALAKNLLRIMDYPVVSTGDNWINTFISSYEENEHIQLHTKQKEAIITALQSKVAVITGGPGTGKTTIIRALLAGAKHFGISDISMAAPTGKAAKRMAESTGHNASTIHRLLGVGSEEFHSKENPLSCRMLIVDESSMIDVFLAQMLVDALKSNARLIFVGDVNQLPSVGAGNVLKDIISSKKVPVVRLSYIYRQSKNSFIALNAQAILQGKSSKINITNESDDFFWMGVPNRIDDTKGNIRELTSEEKTTCIQEYLIKAFNRLLNKGFSQDEIMVLTPTRKGPVGVESLNLLLRNLLNPKIKQSNVKFALGDRVMQIKNNYKKDVFNGDQGRIVGQDDKTLHVLFDGRNDSIQYERDDFCQLTLAYAITVHKSQGCESGAVIQIVSSSQYIMLQRSLLYTGVTRAKKICCLIGELSALKRAIKTNIVAKRNTTLVERLAA